LQLIGSCNKLANSLAEKSLTVHGTHMNKIDSKLHQITNAKTAPLMAFLHWYCFVIKACMCGEVFGQQSSPAAGAAQRAALAATRSTGNMPAVLDSLEDTGGMVLLLFTSS